MFRQYDTKSRLGELSLGVCASKLYDLGSVYFLVGNQGSINICKFSLPLFHLISYIFDTFLRNCFYYFHLKIKNKKINRVYTTAT